MATGDPLRQSDTRTRARHPAIVFAQFVTFSGTKGNADAHLNALANKRRSDKKHLLGSKM